MQTKQPSTCFSSCHAFAAFLFCVQVVPGLLFFGGGGFGTLKGPLILGLKLGVALMGLLSGNVLNFVLFAGAELDCFLGENFLVGSKLYVADTSFGVLLLTVDFGFPVLSLFFCLVLVDDTLAEWCS